MIDSHMIQIEILSSSSFLSHTSRFKSKDNGTLKFSVFGMMLVGVDRKIKRSRGRKKKSNADYAHTCWRGNVGSFQFSGPTITNICNISQSLNFYRCGGAIAPIREFNTCYTYRQHIYIIETRYNLEKLGDNLHT